MATDNQANLREKMTSTSSVFITVVVFYLGVSAEAGFGVAIVGSQLRTKNRSAVVLSRKGNTFIPSHQATPLFVSNPNTFGSEDDMQALILSLVEERTDEMRRSRLKQIFHDNVVIRDDTGEDEAPKLNTNSFQFVKLFDAILNKVGQSIQEKARQNALTQRRAKLEGMAASTEDGLQENTDASESSDDSGMMGEEERQLWACIDMLVQSKTIVKNITAV